MVWPHPRHRAYENSPNRARRAFFQRLRPIRSDGYRGARAKETPNARSRRVPRREIFVLWTARRTDHRARAISHRPKFTLRARHADELWKRSRGQLLRFVGRRTAQSESFALARVKRIMPTLRKRPVAGKRGTPRCQWAWTVEKPKHDFCSRQKTNERRRSRYGL
jgi:hypothetical protein